LFGIRISIIFAFYFKNQGMNKTDYLRNKGILPPDLGEMYFVHSTRTGIKKYSLPIWGVIPYDKYTTYRFADAPYEINIGNTETFGQKDGYGTGVGDLWSWSYFASLDMSVIEKIFDEENLRIITKYQLKFI
jgi:hypothetical protein